jgi:hypothetical protein
MATPEVEPKIVRNAERELRKRNGSEDPSVLDADALGLARVVVRHWGDQAPDVLERAARVAREIVGKWGA